VITLQRAHGFSTLQRAHGKVSSKRGSREEKEMILERVVGEILDKVLGAYFKGIDKRTLQVSVWDGDIRLNGLELKVEALDAFQLPIRVVGGTRAEPAARRLRPLRRLTAGMAGRPDADAMSADRVTTPGSGGWAPGFAANASTQTLLRFISR